MALKFNNPLTERMLTIVNESCIICANRQNRLLVYPKDIFLAVLNDQLEIGCKILEIAGIDIEDLKEQVLNIKCVQTQQNKTFASNMHALSNFILQKADTVSSDLGHNFVGTEHVILAFLLYKGKESYIKDIVYIINEYGITAEMFKDSVINYYMSSDSSISYGDKRKRMSKGIAEDGKNREEKPAKENAGNSLYLKNINKKVSESNTNFIGRDEEFSRAIRILSRKNKNSMIIVGKEGTGKSAFVEGLAKKIVDGQVSGRLKNVTIFSLDLAGMIAGTKYRGQFEERIKNAIDFLSKKRTNEKYVLFIDEIHQILGTGAAEGALDAGAIIKSELSSGNIQCIGATTTKEYKKYILKDGALTRRFSPLFIDEPNLEDTIKILTGIKKEYEVFHDITIEDNVISEIVRLSGRYIPYRSFPDKAIDILDESCTKKSLENSRPFEMDVLESKIFKIRKKIEQYKNQMEFDKCKILISERDGLISELNTLKSKHEDKNTNNSKNILDIETVRSVISNFSGIPIVSSEEDVKKLINIENHLNELVVNQENAVKKISKAILRSKSGLKDPNRPAGVYVFLGDTGSGKSFLAKEVAKYHFGSKERFIRLDMSEYMEKHSVSKIVGAPAGYVGYDDVGGKLVDKIRTNPYCLILLDEFEKAHPDVFNIFLQVFDEGRLTDSHGETVDLKNTIIVMTSNVGVSKLNKKTMGFDNSSKLEDKEKILVEELKKIVSPEFFNRIDDVMVFNSHNKESILKILDMEFRHIKARLADKNIKLECTERALDFIYSKGYSEKYGARPIKRALEKYISDAISLKIISGEYPDNSSILFDYAGGDELTSELI